MTVLRRGWMAIICMSISLALAVVVFGISDSEKAPSSIGLRIESSGAIDMAQAADTKVPKSVKHGQFKFHPSLSVPDNAPDRDGDGVPDVFDAHPGQTGAMSNAVYRVPHLGKVYVFRLNVAPDYLDVYRFQLSHGLRAKGENVADYVVRDEPYVVELVAQAKSFAAKDPKVSAEALLVALVQNISYNSDAYTGKLEYPKYPIETLVDQTGDCEDLAILTVNLLGQLKGYDYASFVYYGDHMGVGVLTDVVKKQGVDATIGDGERNYKYLETTDPAWALGVVPEAYRKKTPVIYRVI